MAAVAYSPAGTVDILPAPLCTRQGRAETVSENRTAAERIRKQSNLTTVENDLGNSLMLAVQEGNRPALRQLVDLYNTRLFNFVCRIVSDPVVAEDIVQETWLSLYERRDSYQPTFRFSTWLFTIARRKALSELRRRKVRSAVRSLTMGYGDAEHEPVQVPQQTFRQPDSTAERAILGAMVERALAMLPEHQREIIILRDIEGFENEEIARILRWNLKAGTVRKRVFDAREAFRRAMLAVGYREES